LTEPSAEILKNRMDDRWRRLGYEILWNHSFREGSTPRSET